MDLFLKEFAENEHKITYTIIFKSSALTFTERVRITKFCCNASTLISLSIILFWETT